MLKDFIKPFILIISLGILVSGCTLKKPVWTPSNKKQSQKSASSYKKALTKQSYTICSDCILLPKGQNALRSSPTHVKGMLEAIHILKDKVQFKGWAADIGIKGPVEKILIFSDEILVYEGSALEERLDVAKALSDGAMMRSGFSVVLDKKLFVKNDGKDASVTVFAIAKGNLATKLPFKK